MPCTSGRLDFSWGHGTEIKLLEVFNPDGSQGGTDPHLSSVLWNAPTSSHRALALSIAPKQAELHQSLQSGTAGGRYGGSSDALVKFCTDVREQLSKERDDDAEGGADTVALEAALWGLLELLCIGASRSEGYIAEDLAAWLAEHSPALDALTPPLPSSPDTTSPAQQERQLAQAAEQAAQGARHCGLTERLAALLESGRPDEQDDYWPAMLHLVAVGRMSDALTLLAAHDAMQHGGSGGMGDSSSSMMLDGPGSAHAPPASILPQFELLDALYVVLRQMPRFRRAAYTYVPAAGAGGEAGVQGAAGGGPTGREFDNMAEFLAYRSTWQSQCANLPRECADLFASARASSPHTVQGVEAVLRVLSGSEQDAVAPTVHWLEFAVAQLVHVRPSLQVAAHLRGLLQASIAARPFNPQTHVVLGLLYDILQAMSDQEGPQGVVEALSSSGAVSTWFMAHVYELLGAVPLGPAAGGSGGGGGGGRRSKAVPVLARPLPLSGGDQAEYWRLLLAESLMSSSSGSAWALALSYLAWCPQHGGDAADIMMEALPVDGQGGDERLLRKALRACESHGLGPQATVLCRTAGAAAWYAGRIGAAARWLGPDGAKDNRRLAAALQPLAAAAGAALWQKLGCYEPTPLLEGPMFEELAPLLESLCSSFSPPFSSTQPSPPIPTPSSPAAIAPSNLAAASSDRSSACSLGLAAQQHPLLAFLLGIHRVHVAAQSLIDACALGRRSAAEASAAECQSTQELDTKLLREQWAAARALRDALMELLGQGEAPLLPHPLVLPLLAYLIPFMEVAGGGGGLLVGVFSSQDVGVLMRVLSMPQILGSRSLQFQNQQQAEGAPGLGDWLSSLQGGWGPSAAGAGAAPNASVASSTAAHPRHAQDVRLALARFAARVHAHEVQHAFGQARQSNNKDATLTRGKRATAVLAS